jgi:ABC-2 type transport system ATP-binding protein
MLKIDKLVKSYGNKRAVDELSLEIEPGEVCAFIGHNGAGKTTTLKSVCGLIQFDSGDIFINGISIKKDPIACKKIIAYIPDSPDLYEFLTGIKYLNFVSDVYGLSAALRSEQIRRYAD